MVTHSFFEDGVFVEDGLKDKIYIFCEYCDNPLIKNMNCSWDKIRNKWVSLMTNFFYTNGSLSRYLYPVLLARVGYLDNSVIKNLGAKWDLVSKK